MLDSFQKRLKCCRAVADLTPKEIVERVVAKGGMLSSQSYLKWERGDSSPRKKVTELDIIVELFSEHGVNTNSDWLLDGEGLTPEFLYPSTLSDVEAFTVTSLQFKKNGWKVKQVAGTYGYPFLNLGDMMLLSEEIDDINTAHMKLAILDTEEEKNIVGIVDIIDDISINIRRDGDNIVKKINITSARLIKWIRKI